MAAYIGDSHCSSLDRVLSINDHNVVYERFKEFSANWEEIAMSLRIKRTSINIIKADSGSSMQRMSQMLVIWLRRETEDQPYPTWRMLCDAFAGIDRVNAEIIAKEHVYILNNKEQSRGYAERDDAYYRMIASLNARIKELEVKQKALKEDTDERLAIRERRLDGQFQRKEMFEYDTTDQLRLLQSRCENLSRYNKELSDRITAIQEHYDQYIANLEYDISQLKDKCTKLDIQQQENETLPTKLEKEFCNLQKQQNETASKASECAKNIADLKQGPTHIPFWLFPLPICSRLFPPCVFTLQDFRRHQLFDENNWKSPSFYSRPGGYKMYLNVYPNGSGAGKDTHISAYICLLVGENDEYLPWPFKGEINIEILNWLEDGESTHHKMTISFKDEGAENSGKRITNGENPGWGYPKFLSHEELQEKYYLDDRDMLSIRIQSVIH